MYGSLNDIHITLLRPIMLLVNEHKIRIGSWLYAVLIES